MLASAAARLQLLILDCMLAPAEASLRSCLVSCLARLARASLIAYNAIAYKTALALTCSGLTTKKCANPHRSAYSNKFAHAFGRSKYIREFGALLWGLRIESTLRAPSKITVGVRSRVIPSPGFGGFGTALARFYSVFFAKRQNHTSAEAVSQRTGRARYTRIPG